jgi:hypothetical protein
VVLKIKTVDELIGDIFGIPKDAVEQAQSWIDLNEMFSELVTCTENTLVIDVESDEWASCPPYIQVCVEDDGSYTLEAISNRFLDPPISVDGLNTLTEMGWEPPIDKKMPNYHRVVSGNAAYSQHIASIIIKTFRDVYLVRNDAKFTIGPVKVIETMLKANPQYADYFTKN